ncbi:hypothetical protein RSEGYP2_24 [Ralstonia phage RsoP1EGY]|uniref:Recombination endonuclease VII n=1 Tax=Ralstonia phage RsoP1EGY TaxID=2070026 RepID=A0A2R2ZGC2_9CAUD|nr:endonuclease VII [Ralstonia phage RsoP1EGY]AUO78184.1 hypothetical protein RSEGYP2_24 [Ralstonia phage RsoP1EGY]
MKTCPSCKTEKPHEAFAKNRRNPDGLMTYCRVCDREKSKAWREANPEKYRDSLKATKYKITREELSRLRESQDGVCAICGTPMTLGLHPRNTMECVDHCHVTGSVRALLCHNCNVGLGMFRDDPKRLLKAAEYLKQHGLHFQHQEAGKHGLPGGPLLRNEALR